jgi:hypothetical protein
MRVRVRMIMSVCVRVTVRMLVRIRGSPRVIVISKGALERAAPGIAHIVAIDFVQDHIDLDGADHRPYHFPLLDPIPSQRKFMQFRGELLERDARADARAERHVAADAGNDIEESDAHQAVVRN